MVSNIYDLIIIGAGPAGMTAGIFAARKCLKTLIITKDFFGMLKWALVVENYPGFKKINGIKLLQKIKSHLDKFQLEKIENRQVVEIIKKDSLFELEDDERAKYLTRSIIICSGGMSKRLEIPGENEFEGKGVFYCATCDGPLFKDKIVAVIGAGNSGCDSALYLSKIAKHVYLFEAMEKLTADLATQKKIFASSKIEIFTSVKFKAIAGQEMVNKIIVELAGEKKEFSVDAVFVQIGYVPVSDFCEKVVKLDKIGQIEVNPLTLETSTPGIFAAGDINNTLFKQTIIAAGQGATAALSVAKFIEKGH